MCTNKVSSFLMIVGLLLLLIIIIVLWVYNVVKYSVDLSDFASELLKTGADNLSRTIEVFESNK